MHRLNNLGAVFTQVLNLSSQEGFDAEWRIVALMTVEGDLVSRAELFDEADLDAAIAKFEQLSCPAPRLENTASQIGERFVAYFAAGDWDAMATILADNFSNDDRRRLVGAGVTHGRDAQMATMRTIAEIFSTNVTTNVTAIRGRTLVTRTSYLLGSRRRTRRISCRVVRHRRDQRSTRRSRRSSCSISTTLRPPSPSSTPDTSPAKRPPTRAHGR